jgi:hypothetical protein
MSRSDRESLANAWQAVRSPSVWGLIAKVATVLGGAFAAGAAGAHVWLARDIGAAVQAEREDRRLALAELGKQLDSGAADLQQRLGWIQSQIVEEYRARVRLQAAMAEPDWRKREAAAGAAQHVFDDALRWPCEPEFNRPGYRDGCVTPEHAARIALATRPPR